MLNLTLCLHLRNIAAPSPPHRIQLQHLPGFLCTGNGKSSTILLFLTFHLERNLNVQNSWQRWNSKLPHTPHLLSLKFTSWACSMTCKKWTERQRHWVTARACLCIVQSSSAPALMQEPSCNGPLASSNLRATRLFPGPQDADAWRGPVENLSSGPDLFLSDVWTGWTCGFEERMMCLPQCITAWGSEHEIVPRMVMATLISVGSAESGTCHLFHLRMGPDLPNYHN